MNRLKEWLAGLTRRERALLACGVGLIGLLVLWSLVHGVRGRMAKQKSAIVEMAKSMDELRRTAAEYRALDSRLAAINAQITDASEEKVMTTLEKIAAEEGLGERLEAMNPKPTSGTDPEYEEIAVEVRLTRMDVESLLRFLFKVETSPGYIRVKTLRLVGKGERGARTLDAVIQVSTFTKKA